MRAKFYRVGKVAVVAQREFALIAIDHDGLRVYERSVSGGGIARVANGGRAGKRRDHVRRENFLHVAEALVHVYVRAVGGGDAGRFLSAMLQRVEAEVGHFRGFGVAENSEHAAVIVKVIVFDGVKLRDHALPMVFSSVPLQMRRNVSMSPWITPLPLYWMRNAPRETVPIRWTVTLHCAAIAVTRASEAGASDTTARAPRSPKSPGSAGSSESTATSAERPSLAKQDSTSVTEIPPSLTSWAERIAFSEASFTRHSIRRFSAARSMAGGAPATIP